MFSIQIINPKEQSSQESSLSKSPLNLLQETTSGPGEYLTWLQAIFDHFAHHGLKLKPSKCHFFKEEISYLGHEISAKGMLPGQKGIEEIIRMGPPTTYTGIRKFIRAVGYFHRFVKNFAQIAKPLNDLLGCGNSKLKNHPVSLTAAAEEAFHTLKKKCATAPM